MPYQLQLDQPLAEEIRRVVLEEIAFALQQLERKSGNHDKAIHETRKSIKKVRGVLKLIRPAIGKTYRQENGRLRQIAGCLSELRDAGAIIETFDSVVHKYSAELQNNSLGTLRRNLLASKRETEQTLNVTKVMKDAHTALHSMEARVKTWDLTDDGFASLLQPGLKATYRAGRKALRQALKDKDADSYHQFRKRAKDHWYHVRLLQDVWEKEMKTREKELHQVESSLGDDHNLTVLREHVKGSPQQLQLFESLARQQAEVLRATAIATGQRLYEQRPKAFVKTIRDYWRTAKHSS